MNDMIERMNTLLEQMRRDNEYRANLIREMENELAELRRRNDEREYELRISNILRSYDEEDEERYPLGYDDDENTYTINDLGFN